MNKNIIVIFAFKKISPIPDCLIKKLCGKTLVQHSIDLAKKISQIEDIVIYTDSQEIATIADRNKLNYHISTFRINKDIPLFQIIKDELEVLIKDKNIILINPYAPLLGENTLNQALYEWKKDKNAILHSVKKIQRTALLNTKREVELIDLGALYIFDKNSSFSKPFEIKEKESIVIETYQDWWICEKLKQQKRIVFNVIGSETIGLGHIYRSLTLAHEVTDHEVIFVCPTEHEAAIKKLAQTDYPIFTAPQNEIMSLIKSLSPHLIVNDILNTSKKLIAEQKKLGVKIVNFEDLGDGGKNADLVVNELYDTPIFAEKHYLWGHKYFFLRDEFDGAIPNKYLRQIKTVLIMFGGTDSNNLTMTALKSIQPFASQYNLTVRIVCGIGYQHLDALKTYCKNIKDFYITIHHGIGIVSSIMENVQLAISSNGRTVYELAEMNIPSIVISHHERESTHEFANPKNGFINLGVIHRDTCKQINNTLNQLLTSPDYYHLLFQNIKKQSFKKNKQKVIRKIMEVL